MSCPAMKSLFLALSVAWLATPLAAEDDWRAAAREFMAEQHFAPIQIKPGSRSQADLARERWAWMQRVYLPPLEKHLAKWPAQAAQVRSFVQQALMASISHPGVDPARPWEWIDKEGAALVKSGVDDPLVLFLAAKAAWEVREGRTDASGMISRARKHKLIGDYPATLAERLESLYHDCRAGHTSESSTRDNLERTRHILKAAADPVLYGPKDDEILYQDVLFVISSRNVKERLDELQKLCATPHFSPWLQHMLQGELQNRIARTHRDGGFSDEVRGEGQQKFEECQTKAREHFIKAWELRPDRADAAAGMIDIIRDGNGPDGETPRLWFDRAMAAQFDHFNAHYQMLWSLRPRYHGSVDQMQAYYCACALLERLDTGLPRVLRQTLDYIEDDVNDIRTVLTREPLKQIVLHVCRSLAESKDVYLTWQHPWQLSDLGLISWAAGDYESAHEIFQTVPVPFPRQTRRRLHLMANEADVRAQCALFSFGMNAEWDAAEEAYARRQTNDALQSYQDMVARFQGEPPQILLERIAACKFEKAFASGQWVTLRASPDMAEWHHLSGFWSGLKTGTLVNTGHGAQAYLLHNGRTGSNFELVGEYEFKEHENLDQGLCIILGYHTQRRSEDYVSCAQWRTTFHTPVASMLRQNHITAAPQVMPPVNGDGSTWKFHVLCRNGAVTYRLNHRDIAADYLYPDEPFEMPEDSVIGFFHHWFHEKSHTHIRRLKIRRLDPPANPVLAVDAAAPANLAALREGFAQQTKRVLTDLHTTVGEEANILLSDLQRERKPEMAAKVQAFVARLKKAEVIKPEEMPQPVPGEEWLSTLLRGYHRSAESRLAMLRSAWEKKASGLLGTAESEEVTAFINAELLPRRDDEPEDALAAVNTFKWQRHSGDWTVRADVLAGAGDSVMRYDFNRSAPFQIDFEITVLDGIRTRLHFANIKFANEEGQPTFALYPREKDAPRFAYERNKPYQITIKALQDKTELYVDGARICEAPKVEGNVHVLQFRAGDGSSKGKTEFRKIRISPLP